MKKILSDKEKRILVTASLRADSSYTEIAQLTKYPVDTVRNILSSLEDQKLIEARNYFDIFKLGFSSYVLLFSIETKSQSKRTEIIDFFRNSDGVVWFAELGGEFEYVANICTGNIRSLIILLDHVTSSCGCVLSKKTISQHISYTDYSYDFLDLSINNSISIKSIAYNNTSFLLDDLDHKIITMLANRIYGLRELARELGQAYTTIQYRLDRLRGSEVWKGAVYLVNHLALGLNYYMFLVSCRTYSMRLREDIHRYCKSNPNIVTLVESIGQWDFEISILSSEQETINNIRQGLLSKFEDNIASINCLPCYRLLKWNQFPYSTYGIYKAYIGQDIETNRTITILNETELQTSNKKDTCKLVNF